MANLIVHFIAGNERVEVVGLECMKRAWEVVEHLIFILMFVRMWVLVSIARVLCSLFPQQIPKDAIANIIDSLSNSLPGEEKAKAGRAVLQSSRRHINRLVLSNPPKGALGRALSLAMELLTGTPASSRKYGFVRRIVDTIITENLANGMEALLEVNRSALEVGFSRTVHLLVQNLERRKQQQQIEASGLLSRMFRALTTGRLSVGLSCFPFMGSIYNFFDYSRKRQAVSHFYSSQMTPEQEMAEKLVQELWWIAQRLSRCSAIEDAIIQWSRASPLARLSIHASPLTQFYLMKISILLLQPLSNATFNVPDDVSFHLLLLWLPFLCNLPSGVEVMSFTPSDRLDAEYLLERTILKLPKYYQESILALWIRVFTQSSSDWPNLQACYDVWCNKTRKCELLHGNC